MKFERTLEVLESKILTPLLGAHPEYHQVDQVFPWGAQRVYRFPNFLLLLNVESREESLVLRNLEDSREHRIEDLVLLRGLNSRIYSRGQLWLTFPQQVDFLLTHWDEIPGLLEQNKIPNP